MPRKSKPSLSVVVPPAIDLHPEPSADLTEFQAGLWQEIAATKPATWWDNANVKLLHALVVHESAARLVDKAMNKFPAAEMYTDEGLNRFEKLGRIRALHSSRIMSLLTKMRLTQQSVYGARQAAEGASKILGKGRTWEIEE